MGYLNLDISLKDRYRYVNLGIPVKGKSSYLILDIPVEGTYNLCGLYLNLGNFYTSE